MGLRPPSALIRRKRREELPHCPVINLLNSEEYLSLLNDPIRIRGMTKRDTLTIIDEVQRLPDLLNEVHYLIEERGARFFRPSSAALFRIASSMMNRAISTRLSVNAKTSPIGMADSTLVTPLYFGAHLSRASF